MVVIGGLGSIGGASVGAVFVTTLPPMLSRYSDSLPFVAAAGSGGYDAGKITAVLYGAAVILIVLFEPGGLSAVGARFTRLVSRKQVQQRRRRAPDLAMPGAPSAVSTTHPQEDQA
jgi:branched-chain amino acid transport system permease protein